MSGQLYSVGTTVAGGIQDIAALLPLLGTDQCENHVGSALDGGYLYAAAVPLSIFGSLGIVKAGISVLISSISIPKLSVYFTFNPHPKFLMTFRGRRWFGARTLHNAGFKPVGTVSSLIAMDGNRYKAETRLMEILEEKHIEDPERLSVEWKSTEWNIMLVVCSMIAAGCGIVPYTPFIFPPYRSSALHSPWIFPLLRTVGSCLGAVCCQFLVQSRVISLMKNRIIFMIMDRTPGVEDLKSKSKEKEKADTGILSQNDFRQGWDERLPSEECLWYLERCLLPTQVEAFDFSKRDIRNKLRALQDEHIQTSSFDYALVLVSWTLLFLSLPATIAGYIGCFTLVSGSHGNDPLIWLGLEAALSIIRILFWAWNPRFDERTDIALRLELAEHQPFVTTEKNVELLQKTGKNALVLVPERRFLEWITSYTGPLEQFQSSENLALYFTLTGNRNHEHHLYLTVFDINKRIAVTLHNENEELMYIDSVVACNKIASEMEAALQSAMGKDHPWRINHATLFDALSRYYFSIMRALNRSYPRSTTPINILETLAHCFRSRSSRNEPPKAPTALLQRKWNLLPKDTESNNQSSTSVPKPLSLTEHDKLYLQRGYEHHLKTGLVENWSSWIVEGIDFIRKDVWNDCHHASADETSGKAKRELLELDKLVASEWRGRELSLLESSFALEGILRERMKNCVGQVIDEWENERLKGWMWSEFDVERRKRLEREREQAKERVEKAMKISAGRAEREGWEWRESKEVWEEGQTFIDEQWRGVVESREGVLRGDYQRWHSEDSEQRIFVDTVTPSFTHWRNQGLNERLAMHAAVERIRNADLDLLVDGYAYPKPSSFAFAKFVALQYCQSQAKVCAASAYDVRDCDTDVFNEVIQKSTTRYVIGVDPDLTIPENDHLFYLSFKGHLQEPPFIQQNRERWWDQQTTNSFTFYFSPQSVDKNGGYVCSTMGVIAQIFIFLLPQTWFRVGLLHCQSGQVSVSLQEKGNTLYCISTNAITERLQLQFFELDQIEPGRHVLDVVVNPKGYYNLRDIFVEFIGDLPDMDVGTNIEHLNSPESNP